MAQSCLRRSGSCLTRLCLLVLDLRYEPELRYSFSCAVYGIIVCGLFLCFCYYFICCGSKSALFGVHDWHADGVGIRSTLASTDPTVAMHPIQDHYSTLPGGMLDLSARLRRFLQSTVADVGPDRVLSIDPPRAVSLNGCAGSPHTLSHAGVVARTPVGVAVPRG